MASEYLRLPLAQGHHETLWLIDIPASCDLDSSQLFLAVVSEDEPSRVITRLPALLRIADNLAGITIQLNRALPGLNFSVVSETPAHLPALENVFWCRLDQHGPWWNRILDARSIMVRIPLDIAVSGLDLFIISPSTT